MQPNRERVAVAALTSSQQRRQMLRDLLRSIAAGTRQPDEVIVVVNRDRRLRDELAEEFEGRATVLFNAQGGKAAGRSVAWHGSTADWLAFIDDDMVVERGWLERLLAAAAAEPGAAIVGGWIEPQWEGRKPAWYTPRLGWVVSCSFTGLPTVQAPVRTVIGGNMMIRRAAMESLGRNILEPQARVWRVLPPARASVRYLLRRSWNEGLAMAGVNETSGPLLQLEQRYARALIAEAARRAGMGVRRLQLKQLKRSAAMVLALGTTGAAYTLARARRGAG